MFSGWVGFAKKICSWMGGWMVGCMDGSKSRFKDCLQQSKMLGSFNWYKWTEKSTNFCFIQLSRTLKNYFPRKAYTS